MNFIEFIKLIACAIVAYFILVVLLINIFVFIACIMAL